MIKKLRSKPFYLILLPIFFLLHITQENYDLISFKSVMSFFWIYCLMSIVTFGVAYIFFRDYKKSAVVTILSMSFFFFFSAFHDFVKAYSPIDFFGRYVFILPFSILTLIVLFIYLKKTTKRFERFSTLLNALLIIYILLDASILIWKSKSPRKHNISVQNFSEIQNATISDSCAKPDIYFLLFDEYAGSKSLKDKYGYVNEIDTFLRANGFHIQAQSRSNYNFTAFSMSSILNMAYLGNFNSKSVTANDYVGCNYLIRHNRVIEFLERNGYEIINYSVFDLKGKPALVQQFFLPQSEKIISERTFFNRINTDIGWNLYAKFNIPINPKKTFFNHHKNNNVFISHIKNTVSQGFPKPRFVYAHLYLPHPPFFFDKNGKLRDPKISFRQADYFNPAAYIGYLQYTNRRMKDLINTILAKNPNAVIVLMADHGYRPGTTDPSPADHFNILNAVYFPGKDYKGFYSNISGCNQFRVIFNKLFQQNFPLLKDSSIFMSDKVTR